MKRGPLLRSGPSSRMAATNPGDFGDRLLNLLGGIGGGEAGEFAQQEGARVVFAGAGRRGGEFGLQHHVEQQFDGAQIAGGGFLDEADDDRLAPRQWPARAGGHPCVERLFQQRGEPPVAAPVKAATFGIARLTLAETAMQRRLLVADRIIRRVIAHYATGIDGTARNIHLNSYIVNINNCENDMISA